MVKYAGAMPLLLEAVNINKELHGEEHLAGTVVSPSFSPVPLSLSLAPFVGYVLPL